VEVSEKSMILSPNTTLKERPLKEGAIDLRHSAKLNGDGTDFLVSRGWKSSEMGTAGSGEARTYLSALRDRYLAVSVDGFEQVSFELKIPRKKSKYQESAVYKEVKQACRRARIQRGDLLGLVESRGEDLLGLVESKGEERDCSRLGRLGRYLIRSANSPSKEGEGGE